MTIGLAVWLTPALTCVFPRASEQESQRLGDETWKAGSSQRGDDQPRGTWSETEHARDQGHREASTSWDGQGTPGWGGGQGGPLRKRRSSSEEYRLSG
jgi:hypothetical protein